MPSPTAIAGDQHIAAARRIAWQLPPARLERPTHREINVAGQDNSHLACGNDARNVCFAEAVAVERMRQEIRA